MVTQEQACLHHTDRAAGTASLDWAGIPQALDRTDPTGAESVSACAAAVAVAGLKNAGHYASTGP